jgi:hypothetical protein
MRTYKSHVAVPLITRTLCRVQGLVEMRQLSIAGTQISRYCSIYYEYIMLTL